MSTSTTLAAIALLPLAAGACGEIFTSAGCSAVYEDAVQVRVQDAASGAPIASGAELIVVDGSYADSASFAPNRPDLDVQALQAGGERAGTYTVIVRKPGYQDWIHSDVQVARGTCHVSPAILTALLQPL